MAETAKRDSPEMRYLLGTLSEDEGSQLEETFFADDAKFEEIELAEDELIDAYVREDLSTDERRQFETRLRTSPRLIERVYFARALADRASNYTAQADERSTEPVVPTVLPAVKTEVSWWERFFGKQRRLSEAFAACLVLLLVGSAVLVPDWLHLRSESQRLVQERAAIQRQKDVLDQQLNEQRTKSSQLTTDLEQVREQLAAQLKRIDDLEHRPPSSPLIGSIVSLSLSPGLTRDGAGTKPELKIRPGTSAAQLNILLERNDYRSYSVSLTTVGGAQVWSAKNLKPRKTGAGHILTLSVPARLLSSHDYIVNVDGVSAPGEVQSVNAYQFRLLKE